MICLIDCGASRCYLDSQVVLRLGLQPIAENATLELGDGTKVPSKGRIEKLIFTMGSRTFSQEFTVTELMSGVDMVLGMSWLEQVNPLINWGSHTMYVRDQEVYYPIAGVSAEKDTKIGTVRHVEISGDQENDQSRQALHSLEQLAAPQFWDYDRDDNRQWRSRYPDKRAPVARVSPGDDQQWKLSYALDDPTERAPVACVSADLPTGNQEEVHHGDPTKRATVARVSTDNPASKAGNEDQQVSNDDQQRSSKFCKRTSKTPRGVQQKIVRSTTSQRQFISLKQMRKLTARGEQSYLLMVRSVGKQKTQNLPPSLRVWEQLRARSGQK